MYKINKTADTTEIINVGIIQGNSNIIISIYVDSKRVTTKLLMKWTVIGIKYCLFSDIEYTYRFQIRMHLSFLQIHGQFQIKMKKLK